MMRSLLGWMCLLVAAVAVSADLYDGPLAGQPFELSSTAERWSALHTPSLIGLNSFTEKQLSPQIWDTVLLPALSAPAITLFGGLALFFFLVSNIRFGGKRR